MNEQRTEKQAEAITTQHHTTVVAASPGAGKTRVLVSRILHQIDRGVPARKIVAITFTNAAAREIRERLEAHVPGLRLGHLGTLHSWGIREIRKNPQAAGYPTAPTVITEDHREEILKELITESKGKVSMKAILPVIAKGPRGVLGAQVLRSAQDKIAIAFWKALRRENLIDYDGVLFAFDEIVQSGNGPVIEDLMVDEFQDSGPVDARIYRGIQAARKFYVGDPDQSIYGFRGGSPVIMTNLCKSPDAHFIGMRENFRSRPGIIEVANDLIAQDRERLDLKIVATREEVEESQEEVLFWADAPDQPTEAAGIAHRIRKLGLPEEGTAVLLRTNHLTQVYTEALKAQGIRIRTIRRENRPEDMEKALALISYAENPRNDANVLRFVSVWKSPRAARDIRKAAISDHKTPDELVLGLGTPQDRPKTLLLLHKRGISADALEVIRNAWDDDLPHSVAIQILRTPEIIESEGEGVTVCTIHAAKGREWDHVFVPAVEEGIIPQAKKDTVLAEERRLLYVAFTRARETLTISWAKRRKAAWGNGEEPVEKSHFLNGLFS